MTVLLRPDNKVPVIGQDTVRQDTYWLPLVCLNHDALKRLKVDLLPEQMHLPGRSVQDVINKAARGHSRCSRHSFESYMDDGEATILATSQFPP